MRTVYVSYGDINKVQLKASAKPLDALLHTGFDLYVETSPKKWSRLVDLPEDHPVNVNFQIGSYKAGLTSADGQVFTVLNAQNPVHRKLAADEGLYIAMPFSPDKREELLKRINNIQRGLDALTDKKLTDLQSRVEKIKERLGILTDLKKLEKQADEKAKAQALWDSSLNDAFSLAETLENAVRLMPNRYDRQVLNEAVAKAKNEVVLETKVAESLLLNAQLLKGMRERFLEVA